MAKRSSNKLQQADLVTEAKERFRQAVDAESKNRHRAVEDLRFIDLGEQWDKATQQERQQDGRPCMVINKTQASIRQITNDARQNKPKIKIRPYDSGSDPAIAELLTGLIRNIENCSDADSAYDTGIECAAKAGWGYWRVITQYTDDDVFEQEILIDRIVNPMTVYDDPTAKKADRSDRNFCFISDTMPRKEFERQFPGTQLVGWDDSAAGEAGEEWIAEDTVRIAEYYYREKIKKTLALIAIPRPDSSGLDYDTIELTPDMRIVEHRGEMILETDKGPAVVQRTREVESGRVMWCKLGGNEIIEGPTEQAGKYIPVVYCAGDESWIEGELVLKSAAYHAKDAARMYNWSRSNSVETLALAPKQPFIGTPEMFKGFENEWDEANRKPKMYLRANIDGGILPQRQQWSYQDTGAMSEAMQASDDIKATMGIYDASLGNRNSMKDSGKAIIALQKEGDNATFHFHDNQRRAIKFTGKILLDIIPKIYDTERVVRIINTDDSEAWAEVNKRVQDPTSPTGYKVINDLSAGKYDVLVDTGPNYATKRVESADAMSQFMGAAPIVAPVLLPRIAKMLDWPDSDAISQELAGVMQPQQQPQQPQGPDPKLVGELEIKRTELKIKEADLQLKQLDIQAKQLELRGKELDNEKAQIEVRNSRMSQPQEASGQCESKNYPETGQE